MKICHSKPIWDYFIFRFCFLLTSIIQYRKRHSLIHYPSCYGLEQHRHSNFSFCVNYYEEKWCVRRDMIVESVCPPAVIHTLKYSHGQKSSDSESKLFGLGSRAQIKLKVWLKTPFKGTISSDSLISLNSRFNVSGNHSKQKVHHSKILRKPVLQTNARFYEEKPWKKSLLKTRLMTNAWNFLHSALTSQILKTFAKTSIILIHYCILYIPYHRCPSKT